MSVKPLNHYALENTASIYDEEALTALELAGRTANKVNEAIEQVNQNEEDVAAAKRYMVDNLPTFVNGTIDKMAADGTLETKLVQAVSSGKVDRNGLEQITYSMLAQDVKAALTGDAVPIVGENSVNTVNIVDKSVTENKLDTVITDFNMHTNDECYFLPLLIINTNNKTCIFNDDNRVTPTNYIFYGKHFYYTLTPSGAYIDTSYWNGSDAFSLWFNPNTNVVSIRSFTPGQSYVAGCVCMGRVNNNKHIMDLHIPIEINGVMYNCHTPNTYNLPDLYRPVYTTMRRYPGQSELVVFDINQNEGTITLVNGGKYNLYLAGKAVTLDLETASLDYSAIDFTKLACYYYFDPVNNTVKFIHNLTNVPSHYIYLGFLRWPDVYQSTSVLPFSVDGQYLYSPVGDIRMEGKLIFRPAHYHTKTVPYVDYDNKKLVFPSCNELYVTTNNSYISIVDNDGVTEDYVVDLYPTWNYLVAGEDGLKVLNPAGFTNLLYSCDSKYCFYLGAICVGDYHAWLNFETLEGASLSVIGDSISSCKGYIPETNKSFYDTEVENMWWHRVMRRCGMYRNKINAHSGGRVTTTRDAQLNGIEFAKAMDNGTPPDNIIVYLGINDFLGGVALGTYDGKGPIPTTTTTFREAYAIMLHNLQTHYPKAKIYACTLPPCERNTGSVGTPEVNSNGVYLFEFNEAIRELATRLNVEVIELNSCGLTQLNGDEYMHDYQDLDQSFLHPNSEGHRLIANKVSNVVLNGRNS